MVKEWRRLPRQLKEEPEGGATVRAPERTWPSLEDNDDKDDAVDSPSEVRDVNLAPLMLAELQKDLMALDPSMDIVREGWCARAAVGGGATFIDPTGKHYPHAAAVKDVMEGANRSSSPQGEEGGGAGGKGADVASSSSGGAGGGGGRGKRGRPSAEAADGVGGVQQQEPSGRGGKRGRSGGAFSTSKQTSKPAVVEEVMWGRPTGCSWWPCLRLNPQRSPEGAPPQPQGKGSFTLVVFLGSYMCSWLTAVQLHEYGNTVDKGLKRKLRADELKKAIKLAGEIMSGAMSVEDAVERAEQHVAEARQEQEALDEEMARRLQKGEGGGGGEEGGERRSKSSRAAAQRSFREPLDNAGSRAESNSVSAELELVLSRSYEITDIGRGRVGLATLMYLVDAGFDFEKLQDDADEDWERKCRGGGRPTFKGIKRLGKLYWVKREGKNPVPAELCSYEDKYVVPPSGKALVCFFDSGDTKWVEATACMAFKPNLERFRGFIKTDKDAAVLAKAESRLHDLSSILMVSGVDQDKGTYIVPATFDRVLRPGSIIEVEVEDASSKKAEWIPGKVCKMLPANFEREDSFQVHIILVNAKERGEWYETYKLSEEGHDWRWPSTSS